MSKFDKIYNEALTNLGNTSNMTTPQQGTQIASTSVKPVLDIGKLNIISQKLTKAKEQNQPVNLTPDELEALNQMLGGNNEQQPQQNTQTPTLDNVQKQQDPSNSANKPLI
jgi:hypothetical protein